MYFHNPPAAIVSPLPWPHTVGLFGNYCSWNCAKRGLLGLRNRPWFSLMGITCLKTGASLPIRMSEKGKPPLPEEKQIVKKIPSSLFVFIMENIHYRQFTNPSTNPEEEEDTEPISFASVSAIQS